jgi:hypothetical protein
MEIMLNAQGDPAIMRSELFGYWRGAFTGADFPHSGIAERAHRGTLFIDEVGNLDARSQGELFGYARHEPGTSIRVLRRMGVFPAAPAPLKEDANQSDVRRRNKQIELIDEAEQSVIGILDPQARDISVDVFLITATSLELDDPDLLKNGGFLEPLYHRLSEQEIRMPPLSRRKEDVLDLFEEKLETATRLRGGRWPKALTREAAEALLSHEWAGNVREVEKVASIVAANTQPWEEIHERHLPLWRGPTRVSTASVREPDKEEAGHQTPADFSDLVSALSRVDFSLMRKEDLRGHLPKLQVAFLQLLAAYLRRALEVEKPGSSDRLLYSNAVELITGCVDVSPSDRGRFIGHLFHPPSVIRRVLNITPALQAEILSHPVLAETWKRVPKPTR